MGSRYGGLKQLDAMGPNGETVLDYSVYDAIRAGFGKVVFVIRRDFEDVFREQVGSKFDDRITVEYAFQELGDLPEGFSVPEGREKPWGTAHAVRAARDVISEPFGMINADDFYGADAYQKLGDFLRTASTSADVSEYCMVGFELKKTLSDFGSVARGVCEAGADGKLAKVQEMTKIVKTDDGAENQEDEANPVKLTGDELVSMNMWGFTPAFIQEIEEKFVAFLQEKGGEMKSECYVPLIVDELINEKRATVDVLATDSTWFGVTYQEDKPHVQKSIQDLIASGAYPENLWA
ncbi:nucleotidyltransferase [Sulfuriroseicoccus oceanibius]|uniref:Nucleotidyltransferase n=2 Tax=Sulfuriroseicoccus oceanibius TaxID=2707525 RepID=A0A6B3L511_9BACT|nr:nucleotidyltransferase [Sulfuriroseicoccus oceanibius]